MSRLLVKEIRGLLFQRNQELMQCMEDVRLDVIKTKEELYDTKQVLSERISSVGVQVSALDLHVGDNSQKLIRLSKQVKSLSDTCGLNVEISARKQLAENSRLGGLPYTFFSTKESRVSVKWKDIYMLVRHIGLTTDEEVVVIRRLCSMLKVNQLKQFLKTLPATLHNVLTWAQQNDLEAIDFENASLQICLQSLQGFKDSYKENYPPLVGKLLNPVLKFLGCVRHASSNKELMQMSWTAESKDKGRFLLMFLTWLVSGEVRSKLEIDAVGICTRTDTYSPRIKEFSFFMAEIKSSKDQVKDAKNQLVLLSTVIRKVLAKVPHHGGILEINFYPLIMVYKGKVTSSDGYTICGFCD